MVHLLQPAEAHQFIARSFGKLLIVQPLPAFTVEGADGEAVLDLLLADAAREGFGGLLSDIRCHVVDAACVGFEVVAPGNGEAC